MAAPTNKTTLEVAMDCIEALFETINHEQGYRTNGILVDRDKDPRALRENKPEKYRQLHAAISIGLGKRVQDPKITAGRIRWQQHYVIMGLRTLTKDEDLAGRKLDGLIADMQDDLARAIRRDPQFGQIAAILGIEPPCVANHHIYEFENDEGIHFPDGHFLAKASFIYDEFLA